MLSHATPFGQVGSYGLLIDRDLPAGQQVAELVRVLRKDGADVAIAFPLRDGASGNKTVPLADMIDASPLNRAETRELTELTRALFGKPSRGAKAKRLAALKQRATWFPVFAKRMDALHARQRQRQRAA